MPEFKQFVRQSFLPPLQISSLNFSKSLNLPKLSGKMTAVNGEFGPYPSRLMNVTVGLASLTVSPCGCLPTFLRPFPGFTASFHTPAVPGANVLSTAKNLRLRILDTLVLIFRNLSHLDCHVQVGPKLRSFGRDLHQPPPSHPDLGIARFVVETCNIRSQLNK